MRLILALFATLWLGATPALACGLAAQDHCQVESGSYRISVPAGADRPAAMVWLHGWGGSADGVMKNKGMVRRLAGRGIALIAPNGIANTGFSKNRNWSVVDGRDYDRDDIAFLDQVITDAVERHGIDRDRILLSGFSRGGSMVWDAACFRPALARAYAPVAGAFWEPLARTCAGPVDLFHTHGWTDRTVPLEGRPLRGGAMIQGDVFQSLYMLRAVNGCANRQPEEAPVQESLWHRSWTDCDGLRRIDLMLHPGGHSIPKGWLDRALDWFQARLTAG